MPKPLQVFAATFAFLLTAGLIGCTLYPEKNPPTLATTTSAEQHERILWQMVQKQQWTKISPLFATTLVWNVEGKSLTGEQVVPYLQSRNLKDAIITDATIKPNGPDMTLSYALQVSDDGGGKGCAANYLALSVWQQIKSGGYVLIAHSEQRTGSTCTAS